MIPHEAVLLGVAPPRTIPATLAGSRATLASSQAGSSSGGVFQAGPDAFPTIQETQHALDSQTIKFAKSVPATEDGTRAANRMPTNPFSDYFIQGDKIFGGD